MNCWMLQCKINDFCWFDYMKDHLDDPDTWGIDPRQKKFIEEIALGDIVFIWLTQHKRRETRGIYAVGKITGLPDKNRQPFPYERAYWVNKEAQQRHKQKILLELRYTNTKFIDKPISKDELEAAGLGNLLILRMHRATIYKVTKECEIIKKMVETR